MTDYDINKVSPRPWKAHEVTDKDYMTFQDVDGSTLGGVYFDSEPYISIPYNESEEASAPDLRHIVHCVNMHDELVAALDHMDYWAILALEGRVGREGSQELIQSHKEARQLLARAKGES